MEKAHGQAQKPPVRGRPSLCDEKEGRRGEAQSRLLPAAAGGRQVFETRGARRRWAWPSAAEEPQRRGKGTI